MITIIKKVKISKDNRKVEFDLDGLPEGEYKMQLIVYPENKTDNAVDFSSWSSDINIPSYLTFN